MGIKLLKQERKNISDVEGFKEYLNSSVFTTPEEVNFINTLCKNTDVYLFSGIIRDYFFSEKMSQPRDVDIVLDDINKNIRKLLENKKIRKTQFGGYKLKISDKIYDVWPIKKTWYFENFLNVLGDWHKFKLPETAFFNVSAVMYSLNDEKFYEKGFSKLLENKNKYLGVVNEVNPLPSLCIIRTIDYSKKYRFRLRSKLKDYILEHYRSLDEELINVQLKHYGEIRYSKEVIEDFIEGLKRKHPINRNSRTNRQEQQLTFPF